MQLSLAASAPDILQQTIPLCQSVQGIVALAHGSHEAAQGVDLALACESAILINLANRDLDRCVVLGLDNAVGGAALAGDVTVKTIEISFNSYSSRGISSQWDFGLWNGRTGRRVLPCRFPSWRFFCLWISEITGRLDGREGVD
jgi:hypothetical protein